LEDQLSIVESRIHFKEDDSAPLTKINELSDKMEEAGITTNRHTTQTAKDVEVLFDQVNYFFFLFLI